MTFQLMLFPGFRDKALTLSYDDGCRQDIRLIEIMSKYGLKGTFNLNSGYLDLENKVHAHEFEDLYYKTGNEIAVHGVEHYSLKAIPDDRIINDIFIDRLNLEKFTGRIIKGMAYANGSFDDMVVDVLKKCGISYSRTTRSTEDFEIDDDWLRLPPTCHHNNERLFELVDKFLSDEKKSYFWGNHPKLFYLWGHSYEFDRNDGWARIERFAEMVGNRDDVWYATNGEIVSYVEAFKALEYSGDGKTVCNPTCTDVYIKTKEDKKYLVPAGQTIKI